VRYFYYTLIVEVALIYIIQCCNAEMNGGGGWGVFNAILGWENSATYGSVISYNLYWIFIIVLFLSMHYNEKHGHWPLMKRFGTKNKKNGDAMNGHNMSSAEKTAGVPEVNELGLKSSPPNSL